MTLPPPLSPLPPAAPTWAGSFRRVYSIVRATTVALFVVVLVAYLGGQEMVFLAAAVLSVVPGLILVIMGRVARRRAVALPRSTAERARGSGPNARIDFRTPGGKVALLTLVAVLAIGAYAVVWALFFAA